MLQYMAALSGSKKYFSMADSPETLLISRRELLAILSCGLGIAGCTGSYLSSTHPQDTLKIELPRNTDPENPGLDVFIALSKLITLKENLDHPTAEKIHRLVLEEPAGAHHLSSSYDILCSAFLDSKHKAATYSPYQARLDAGQQWFISHLLTTWYLGIYYHADRQTVRVTYEKSLMFDAVDFFYPIPMMEALTYGAWGAAPVFIPPA